MVSQGDTLQLNSGMRCAKYMLLIVSFMFAVTAVLLMMVGSTIQAIFGDFEQFIDDHFSSPPALLIAIGFIMLFVSSLGAYGALKESVMLINLYGVFLFLVFVLEVAAAFAAFALRGEVGEMLYRTMNESLADYENYPYIRDGVDLMQSELECCGARSPNDWRHYYSPNKNLTNNDNNKVFVPKSCCVEFNEDTNSCEDDLTFSDGCLNRLYFITMQSTMLIATAATTVAFVQLLGVICAVMLAKTLRRNKSIREARRWQLQQSLSVLISGGKAIPPTNAHFNGYTQLEKSEHLGEQDPVTYTAASPSVN